MVLTKEEIKKKIVCYIDEKTRAPELRVNEFSLDSIVEYLGDEVDFNLVNSALNELTSDNKDNLLIEKKYETTVYLLKSDKQVIKKIGRFLKSPNLTFWGAVILTGIVHFTPFSIFNYPETYKGGFILGLWVSAITVRFIGENSTKIWNLIISKLSELSSINKRSISITLFTMLFFLAFLFLYSKYIVGLSYHAVPAWEIIGVMASGVVVGAAISKWLFK